MRKIGIQIKGVGKAISKKSIGGVISTFSPMTKKFPEVVRDTAEKSTGMSEGGFFSKLFKKKKKKDKEKRLEENVTKKQKRLEELKKELGLKKGGMPARNKKNFRSTKSGAGMTQAGVAAYRRMNPGSKLKTAVTGKVKPGSKDAKRRKSFCARSAGQMKKFPKAAKDPNSRLRQARRRWKC